jgi:hypothetical protein
MHGSVAHKLQGFLPILSVTWSINLGEIVFLLSAYLGAEEHLIDVSESGDRRTVVITAKGWRHLETVSTGDNATGFVAMWFDDQMTPIWEQAFYPSIYDAGYTPLRIDKKEHNNKIDDEILASIRVSKFVVADFTEQRGGVYYEAGFASGLAKPVIWTVRKDHLHNVHFDTRQFTSHGILGTCRHSSTRSKNELKRHSGAGPYYPLRSGRGSLSSS